MPAAVPGTVLATTNSSTSVPPAAPTLPVNEWPRPSVVVLGDLLYLIGGFGNSGDRGALSRIQSHDLTEDMTPWNTPTVASMAIERDNNSAVALNGRIYVIGGNPVGNCVGVNCVTGVEYRSAEVYDPARRYLGSGLRSLRQTSALPKSRQFGDTPRFVDISTNRRACFDFFEVPGYFSLTLRSLRVPDPPSVMNP